MESRLQLIPPVLRLYTSKVSHRLSLYFVVDYTDLSFSLADGPVDAVAEDIAKSTGISPGQVLLKWAQQIGDIVVTTSSKESRMKEQLAIPSLPDLSEDQINAITEAGAKKPSQRKYMLEVFQN